MYSKICAIALGSFLISGFAHAAVINFNGPLKFIEVDSGGAVYSGVPVGTSFVGNIDDVTANGAITGGGVTTNFTCCDAAGGLEFDNDVVLDAEMADDLNTIFDTTDFAAGQMYDTADLEGDSDTAGGGRIEVGLSFIFPSDTYSNADDPSNILDPTAALRTLFFVLEEDTAGVDIYSGIGVAIVPIPGAVWLFGSALGLIGFLKRRKP